MNEKVGKCNIFFEPFKENIKTKKRENISHLVNKEMQCNCFTANKNEIKRYCKRSLKEKQSN